jgi:hypothetical protein
LNTDVFVQRSQWAGSMLFIVPSSASPSDVRAAPARQPQAFPLRDQPGRCPCISAGSAAFPRRPGSSAGRRRPGPRRTPRRGAVGADRHIEATSVEQTAERNRAFENGYALAFDPR